MTPEAQRICIAEACGWKPNGTCSSTKDGKMYQNPKSQHYDLVDSHNLPDYLNDLNACAEMEKVLETDKAKWEKYAHLVCMTEIVVEDNPTTLFDEWGWYGLLKATAAQRCESFLRTLSLWRE